MSKKHYSDVTETLQECYRNVTVTVQNITGMLQEGYSDGTETLQACYRDINGMLL